jgi:hypothetical protein
LPGLALLNMERFDLEGSQDREVSASRKDAAVVRDDGLGATVLRERHIEDLQHGGEVLMFTDHAGQHLARVALHHTDAINPAAVELNEIRACQKSVLVSIRRTMIWIIAT